ncbi:unnamed protein product [Thelazia callipaeda]|uniref:RING-type domain-containing protein n=1 Tax=Thelazia callipaeda TaxID=103827 RepID=A0A0N5CSD3_THECL|nr:unnamed protein product [Thelazia callipaeda]
MTRFCAAILVYFGGQYETNQLWHMKRISCGMCQFFLCILVFLIRKSEMSEALQRPQCSICSEWIKLSETSALSCGHLFHSCCIVSWIKTWGNCPVCRKKIINEDQIVRHLFFQVDDSDFSDQDHQVYALRTKLNDLLEELKASKDTNKTLKAVYEKQCVRYNRLKRELHKQRKATILMEQQVMRLEKKYLEIMHGFKKLGLKPKKT